jgi:phosphoserine phosphatase
MRTLHLIRHGETNWNRERRAQGQQESVLTDTGREQARQLREALSDTPVQAVYVSSSRRARETAEIVFSQREVSMEYCDLLREISMGPWEGQLYADIQKNDPQRYHAFWNQPDAFLLSGAETFADIQRRALSRLEKILAETDAEHIAIVSHGVWIKSLLCAIEGRELADLWQPPAMHNCARSTIQIQRDGSRRIILYCDKPYEHPSLEIQHEH